MLHVIFDKMADVDGLILKKQRGFCYLVGGIFLLAGVACFCAPAASSIVFSALVGWLFLFGGIFECVGSLLFREYSRSWSFVLGLLLGLAYVFVGYQFLAHPALAVMSLSLIIGTLFVASGIMRGTVALTVLPGTSGKGLFILSAVMELLIGILILQGWPADSSLFLALLLGIQLIMNGINFLSLGKVMSMVLENKK